MKHEIYLDGEWTADIEMDIRLRECDEITFEARKVTPNREQEVVTCTVLKTGVYAVDGVVVRAECDRPTGLSDEDDEEEEEDPKHGSCVLCSMSATENDGAWCKYLPRAIGDCDHFNPTLVERNCDDCAHVDCPQREKDCSCRCRGFTKGVDVRTCENCNTPMWNRTSSECSHARYSDNPSCCPHWTLRR